MCLLKYMLRINQDNFLQKAKNIHLKPPKHYFYVQESMYNLANKEGGREDNSCIFQLTHLSKKLRVSLIYQVAF